MDESKLYAYCLQGDVTKAYKYLQSFPEKSKKTRDIESEFYRRFFAEKPIYDYKTDDPWIRKVLLAYYEYFSSVLTGKSEKDADIRLGLNLRKHITWCKGGDNLDVIEAKLETIFNEKGYQFLGGVTTPFRGPYIWKTSIKEEFNVELPYHVQRVTVFFLSDFILQSWLHFATFGKKYAAGWAKADGLYYVLADSEMPDFESSEFQVSYLKHEAQHMRDYAEFPGLNVKDLEYRAKLVELIYENDSTRLLGKFFYEQKNDPHHPHPYSSFCIMRSLTPLLFGKREVNVLEEWNSVDTSKIQDCAKVLYDEHTNLLKSTGQKGII